MVRGKRGEEGHHGRGASIPHRALSFCQAVSDLSRFLNARSGCLTIRSTGAFFVSLKGAASPSRAYSSIGAGRTGPDNEGPLGRLVSFILRRPGFQKPQPTAKKVSVVSRPGERSGLPGTSSQRHRLTRLRETRLPAEVSSDPPKKPRRIESL